MGTLGLTCMGADMLSLLRTKYVSIAFTTLFVSSVVVLGIHHSSASLFPVGGVFHLTQSRHTLVPREHMQLYQYPRELIQEFALHPRHFVFGL